ncbi:hypothetical protein MAPG_02562 [Magnaporthiopsis poae ATCC 64411]|uniref:Uncharacterized protein n=1 Tax=Magnaporthiopsis poae (strain ATCC 64411 / 73-15) TaxID=644358 RepID=A0A0C4DRP7_MAGP6|nr:hypothetical protein MAPG_02562 [Magnaporthiopsis poae ATCC 64411]
MAAEERDAPSHAALQHLAKTVQENLTLEKDWTGVAIHPVAAPATAVLSMARVRPRLVFNDAIPPFAVEEMMAGEAKAAVAAAAVPRSN